MFISIDEKAAAWFAQEFDFSRPFSIRMYPQYAGFGEKHKGYSLAFSIETPANAAYIKDVNGITLFIESNDLWYFEDTETFLSIDQPLNELQVSYREVSNITI